MFKKVLFILCMSLMLTGCVKTNTQITINDNDTVDIEYKTVLDKKALAQDGMNFNQPDETQMDQDRKENLEKELGLKLELVNNDDEMGIKGTRHIENLKDDEWNQNLDNSIYKIETNNKNQGIIQFEKKLFKNIYKIDMDITANMDTYTNTAGMDSPDMVPNEQILAMFKNVIKTTYEIKVPSPAKEHNSTKVDVSNNLYSWDLEPNAPVHVKLIYEKPNMVNIVSLVVLLGALLFFGLSARKK